MASTRKPISRFGIIELASPEAGKIALRAGNADIIVSDWLWVSRERGLGAKLTFYPYSSALGAVMVPAASPIRTLADLKGRKLAVAGGPIDKNWLLLQAWLKQDGIDLKSEATIVYGAPPLLTAKTLSGEMDATLNYWNFCAVLEAKGFRRVAGIEDLLPRLGASGRIAMIGYVFDETWAGANQDVDRALHRDDPQGEGNPGDLGCGVGEDCAADRRARCRDPARLSRSLPGGHSAPSRSPTKKPTRACSTACWRRSAAANWSARRQNSIPAPSITRSLETEVLRLLSFAVFLATWWIAVAARRRREAAAASRRARGDRSPKPGPARCFSISA